MQEPIAWIFNQGADTSLLFLRLVIAYFFIPAGWQKLMAGEQKWLWLGNQMQYFGIYFLPITWGLLAACTEFFGGVAMLLGVGVRIAAFFMMCVMIVALRMHFATGDSWQIWWRPLSLFIILIALIFAGAGYFSFNALIMNYFSK